MSVASLMIFEASMAEAPIGTGQKQHLVFEGIGIQGASRG
jgi:hypothetical protein